MMYTSNNFDVKAKAMRKGVKLYQIASAKAHLTVK